MYIKNPSEKVQLKAIKQTEYAIEFIENPSEKAQIQAIKQNIDCLSFIQNPTKKVLQCIQQMTKNK